MSVVEDVIAGHLEFPWLPGRHAPDGVPGAAWTDLIADEVETLTGMRPSAKQVSAATLAQPGVTKGKASSVLYCGVTALTRAERAAHEVIYGPNGGVPTVGLWAETYHPLYLAAQQEHADRKHGGNRHICRCGTPQPVYDQIARETEAAIERYRTDGTVAERIRDSGYGPYLAWRPGDPDPGGDRPSVFTPAMLAALRSLPPEDDDQSDQSDQW